MPAPLDPTPPTIAPIPGPSDAVPCRSGASRRSTALLLAALWLAACGGDPAPAAPPVLDPEFDDPFADDAEPAAPADAPAPADPASAPAVAATPEPAGPPSGPATPADGATPTADVPAPTSAPQAAVATAERTKRPAKAPRPSDAPSDMPVSTGSEKQVPSDTPLAPEPAPAAEPAPAPAPTPPPAPAVPEQQRFAGSYAYAGGQAQRDGIADAVETSVMALSVFIRPIARKKITEGNPLREQLTIKVVDKTVTVSFGPDRTVTGQIDGPPVPWTGDLGDPLNVTFTLVKGRLVMFCKADSGSRRNVFTLNEAGDKVTLSVTMSSERLPVPIKYALTYRRK